MAVAGAIPGLAADDVAMINLRDGSQYGEGGEVPADAFNTPLFQEKTRFEQQLKARVEAMLNRFIKPSASVQITAELDDMLSAETRTVKPEGESQPIRQTQQSESSSKTQVEDRGQPGVVANGPSSKPVDQAVAKNENTEERTSSDVENMVPISEETQRRTGLTPKHVRAAIAVPSEYLVRVWRERATDQAADAKPDSTLLEKIEEETKTKIKASVAQLFPKEVADDQLSKVEVTVFQSLTPDPVVEPSVASQGLLWAKSNSGSLLMAGLAIVSLLMLRSMMKAIPAAEKSLAFTVPAIPETTASEPNSPASSATSAANSNRDPGRPRLRLKKGPTLKDDLTELVKEDPDGAAAILRTWIGNAA
jgi:flagellar M-ring protein FliF